MNTSGSAHLAGVEISPENPGVQNQEQPRGRADTQHLAMPTNLTWTAIVLRLLLTTACAGVLGLDRDKRGHSAGLRTTLLVALAACLSMIQANWLINSTGKPEDSFVVMDIMRLPLGILSGIGFIGAGAIIKRGELAVGMTTAAMIWFVTVMGLCFGGGQIGLGLAGFVLAFLFLTTLRKLEIHMTQQHRGDLKITVSPDGLKQDEIALLLVRNGLSPTEPSVSYDSSPNLNRVYGWKVQWRGKHEDPSPPATVQELATYPGILRLELTR
jgi:putative Mg2+ transporter-C (MgtC) family protein